MGVGEKTSLKNPPLLAISKKLDLGGQNFQLPLMSKTCYDHATNQFPHVFRVVMAGRHRSASPRGETLVLEVELSRMAKIVDGR